MVHAALLLLMLEVVHTNLVPPSAESAAPKIFSYPQAAGRLPHLLAPSGHGAMSVSCPLSGVKRTFKFEGVTSAFDRKRTLAKWSIVGVLSPPNPFQCGSLSLGAR